MTIATNALRLFLPSWTTITKASIAARAVSSTIAYKSSVDPFNTEGSCPRLFSGKIVIQNVGFFYPSQPTLQVLDNINMIIEAGKSTAIIGPSGSGKSTIINLLERWYEVSKGSFFFFDEIDIRILNIAWLRSQIGIVQQVSRSANFICSHDSHRDLNCIGSLPL